MKIELPKIESKKCSDKYQLLKGMIPHYTPEWEGSDAGDALLKIFSQINALVVNRLNQVPKKNFVAFLDMLGIKLLPAQPARAPLTFKLAKGTQENIRVPVRTQASGKSEEQEELTFETEKELLATISNLQEVISVDPFKDSIYIHTANIISKDGDILEEQKAFTLFSGDNMQEHSLYLGHKNLFNIESKGKITIEITLATEVENPILNLKWEYWGEDTEKEKDDWIPFQIEKDETNGFSFSGRISLLKTLEGKIKEEKLDEIFKKTFKAEIKGETIKEIKEKKTRWIRCKLNDPLIIGSFTKLPTIDTIFITASPNENIKADAGFFNDVPLDLTQEVYPFGRQPRIYDTFYIGSQEAFSKKEENITLFLDLSHDKTNGGPTPSPEPKLSWEYWNGKGWQAIANLNDGTVAFLNDGKKAIEFNCPGDIEETEVSGQKNYWIRVRIVNGDYGREEYSVTYDYDNVKYITTVTPKYKLPKIQNLTINYSSSIKKELQYCLTYNNLDHQDRTSASGTTGQFLQPFIPMEDTYLNLYLGFDKLITGGPICIFFAARELTYTEGEKPKMDWSYRDKTGWTLLDHLDETDGLIVQGNLEFIGSSNFISYSRFGQSLYWIQASLVKGRYESLPELQGIYPNTAWSIQAETTKDEILGSSNGESFQSFSFLKFPVLKGQEIRINEFLSEEEKQALKTSLGEDAIHETKDEKGNVTETWVLWSEVPDFFDSSPTDRHYILDHAMGKLQFSDGINGMIPQARADNIKAFLYQAGGGKKGNIGVREIKSIKSAVAGIDKVSNPVAADGGADTASLEQMLEIGPAMISNRNRAITAEDFEWLAKKASRKVVKVRCLPNTNNKKQTETGWVTVIIVPDSPEDKPFPSLELRKKVREYLEAHSANTLTGAEKHIYVDGPSYVGISVSADVFVISIDIASEVEREVMRKLTKFFHPLTGGPEEMGWEFGRDVSASDIYALLEKIKGVDHVENLKFTYEEAISSCKPPYEEPLGKDIVVIGRDCLVSTGIHKINLQLANGGEHHGST